jgi:hypothetical protein
MPPQQWVCRPTDSYKHNKWHSVDVYNDIRSSIVLPSNRELIHDPKVIGTWIVPGNRINMAVLCPSGLRSRLMLDLKFEASRETLVKRHVASQGVHALRPRDPLDSVC